MKLGFINFGGPTGQIALMHHELVERRRWIGDRRFFHALSYCMLLPGPEAQQLAIYIGWLMHRVAGGLVAGVFFILPAYVLMLVLSWLYATQGDVTWVASTFYGLKAAVVGIVAAAAIRIGARALRSPFLALVAAAAFVSIFVFGVAFPLIVLAAILVGLAGGDRLAGGGAPEAEGQPGAGETELAFLAPHPRPSVRRTLVVLVVGLAAWWIPLGLVVLVRGPGDVLSDQALFFSKAAMVTFGGAYAVLAYINQAAVEHFGWLGPGQMVTGLGLAESTPGPLIMVAQFVGFMGAYRFHGSLDPVVSGVLGATVTVWATFAPCFLWIFLGAPFIEELRGKKRLSAALSTVTAAVVGVVANLAVWFGIHTLFTSVRVADLGFAQVPAPELASVDWFVVALSAGVFAAIWRLRLSVLPVVLASAAAGLLYRGFS